MSKKNGPASNWPDQRHFLRLQEALWDKAGSRASLMVGAGFSKNAKPSPGVGGQFPTWSALADYMAEELYPSEERSCDDSPCRPPPLRSPERIAGEYEVTFGRAALEDLIRKRVPDTGTEPGALHQQLLRLPWQDVFTTNYDTLLERTSVPGRSYHTVATVRELTRALSPRIIKLHGSLSSDVPLIATEEDYRTYPRRFAPFVNTVRQTLIERSLVLVGFSGDDRNFLEWTGWMRDELGDHHCPIYLVVVHGLDDIQRSLLENRGVTPIDLSRRSRCGVGEDRAPAVLIHDFIQRLWQAQPLEELWTVSMKRLDPDHSTPADSDDTAVDRRTGGGDPSAGKVKETLREWKRERMAYPGWVIAPASRRRAVWHATMNWIDPVLKASAEGTVADRISVLSELNWRFDVAMIPLLPQWLDPLEAAIDAFERGAKTDHPNGCTEKVKGHTVEARLSDRVRWGELVLATARAARETHDGARWTRHMERAEHLVERCPELADRYHQEKALWQLAQIDRAAAREVVVKWMPTESAPLGMLWKAGVLAEVGQLEEARELLRRTLQAIRIATQVERGRNVELLSTEGWCTYLLLYVESSIRFADYLKMRDEVWRRWRELSVKECNPLQIQEHFSTALGRKAPVRPQTVENRPTFDPGKRNLTGHFGGGLGPWLPAFACLRWAERVGLPMRTRGMSGVGQSELIWASKWVSRFLLPRSISVLVRMGAANVLRDGEIVGRPRMASMDDEDVESLKALTLGAVTRESAVLRDEPRPWLEVSVVNAVIEVSSRLTLKLGEAELMKSFTTAMAVYAEWRGRDLPGFGQAVTHWFRRLYEAADPKLLARWLPALLEAPLVPEDGPRGARRWHDPLDGFPIRRLGRQSRSGGTGRAMRGAVGRLLQSAGLEVGERREMVVWRLSSLWRENLLTAAERRRAGALLWAERASDGLPYWRELEAGDYTALPSPKGVDVPAVIKQQLLRDAEGASSGAGGGRRGGVLGSRRGAVLEVGPATQAVLEIPYEPVGVVTWEPGEAERLWRAMDEWWSAARMTVEIEQDLPAMGESDGIRARAPSVEMFLVRVRVAGMAAAPEEEWEQLLEFVGDTRKYGVLLTAALPYFLIHRPDRRDDTADRVIDDLAGDEGAVADCAARAVRHWVHLADAQLVEPVPDAVIGALVDRVAFRRLAGARLCLRELSAVLVEKGAVIMRESVDRLISSLTAWAEAVAPELDDHDGGGIAPDERPDLRERVGLLANALATWWEEHRAGLNLPEPVRRVLDRYRDDPLPEVRRAVSEGRWRY